MSRLPADHAGDHQGDRQANHLGGGAPRVIRVAIVDDHWMVRRGMRSWIESNALDLEVAADVGAWAALLRHPAYPTDVVLLDVALGDDLPLSVKIAALRSAGCAVVVVSTLASAEVVREAIEAGALGYLPKSAPELELAAAIRSAARGESYITGELAYLLIHDSGPARPNLSEQERRVLTLYASGLTLATVARRMNLRYETAKSYLDRVRDKYERFGRDARTKLDLYRRAVEDGWLDDDR